MAELQFEGLAADGEPENLVTKTNSEDRFFAEQSAERLVRVRNRRWIARTIRQKNSVRLEREDFVGARRGRNDRDGKTIPAQTSQNIFLNAEVVGYDPMFHLRQRMPHD